MNLYAIYYYIVHILKDKKLTIKIWWKNIWNKELQQGFHCTRCGYIYPNNKKL